MKLYRMRYATLCSVALGAMLGPGGTLPAGAAIPARPAAIVAVPIVTGLNFPAAFTIAADGRIFYAERLTGQIRIYDPSDDSNTPFYRVTHLKTKGEQGLLGLALDPSYPAQPFLYAYATRKTNGKRHNQILRITDAGGTGSVAKVIWTSNTTAAGIHNGGRILFGPDGMLYAFQGAPTRRSPRI